jgi:uncharacterized membrane protein
MDYRFATVQGQRVEWLSRQNCAMSPAQIGIIYLSLIGVSLAIGLLFWFMGATLVLPFCLLELLILGVCFLCFAKRALDRERICIEGAQVTVECELSGVLHRTAFQREWLRVETPRRAQSLIELRGQGQVVAVGRFVRPEWRSALAAEIKRAARTA